jgi:DMSO/TMAO reductase YedYZ molybdopterin-dependent catalytic subunit
MASLLSAMLLPLILIAAITGFLSHSAYDPHIGANATFDADPITDWALGWTWPTAPVFGYAFNQGLHVVSGLIAFPILLAKLWVAIPQLWEWPPVRSAAHLLERIGLFLLVGGALFVFATGILNIQYWYVFGFSFVPAHYYGAVIFLVGLAVHVGGKIATVRRELRGRGLAPLREGLEDLTPEPPSEHSTAPVDPAKPTISRRGMLAGVGAGSVLLGAVGAGQSIGGPLRELALFGPRGPESSGAGPNDFPVNKTADVARVTEEMAGPGWRLELVGAGQTLSFSRDELLELEQVTERLPIACVEGWSTTQRWTGVRLAELCALAGVPEPETVLVESLQPRGAFRQVTLSRRRATDPRTLLALRVNGAELSMDHGFPARMIIPNAPGVHNTKWVGRIEVRA